MSKNSLLPVVFSWFVLAAAVAACSDPVEEVEDLVPPAAPTALDAVQLDRVYSNISWVAPADDDGSPVWLYDLRFAREPLADTPFQEWGFVIETGQAGVPGVTENVLHLDLPGYGFYVGVVAIDEAGNRSEPALAGPFFMDVNDSGAILPPNPDDDDNGLGYQIETGYFNGDQYPDLAISAPFKRVVDAGGAGAVYIHYGGPTGINPTADVEIAGTEAAAQFGNSIAVLDWDGDDVDDLAVGAPFGAGFTGQVFVFSGQSLGAGNPLVDTDAETVIGADPGSAWFAGSILGWTLAAGRFDSDGRDDLAIASVVADQGVGAVIVLYGGTSAGGDIMISELDPAPMDGAIASVIFAPGEVQGGTALFGSAMQNLGRSGPGSPDQLGVAFFQGADAFIIRGRADKPADPGVTVQDFDLAIDLRATVDELDPETFFAFSQSAAMDINSDGVREVAIGSYRDGADAGTVTLIDGAAVGEQLLSAITVGTLAGTDGQLFGSAIVGNGHGLGTPDFDGDGNVDLVIAGATGPDNSSVGLYVWYNDGYHNFTENLSSASADIIFAGPETFTGTPPTNGGTPINARSVGDLNGDGFDDIIWADWTGNDLDGSFVVIH